MNYSILIIVAISAFVCGAVAGYVVRNEKDDFSDIDIDMTEDAP